MPRPRTPPWWRTPWPHVEAGRRGGFGLVVGVDRTVSPYSATALRRRGADVVVADPGELLMPEEGG